MSTELVALGSSSKQKPLGPTLGLGPFPASSKVFVPGRIHPSVRVPMREIALAAPNAPVRVYDTSGPYTDVRATVDVKRGVEPVRRDWILARGDVEELPEISSEYGRLRLADTKLDKLRFGALRKPMRAKAGRNVTQMHYARKGLITPEMEFIALTRTAIRLWFAMRSRADARSFRRTSITPRSSR